MLIGRKSVKVESRLRVLLCGRNLGDLRRVLAPLPLRLVRQNPDLVISYGGDGALLGAERDYPAIPKLPLRDRRSSAKCDAHAEAEVLRLYLNGSLTETRLSKLEGITSRNQRVTGLNDVMVCKENIASAVRFRLWLDGEPYRNQIVGDGLVVATPFGSTGYYRSITHSLFRVGIGLAFNNSTEPLDHLVVDASTRVEIEITRGPAVLLADNDPVRLPLDTGDRVTVRQSAEVARIVGLDVFRCKACWQLRQQEA